MDKAHALSAASTASKKEIIKRADTALKMFETSKPDEISNYDLIVKINEALRLIKELASEDTPSNL